MADGMRSMRWRVAILVVAAALVMAWVWMTGGTTHVMQIDYTWGGPFLDSAQVELDGQIIGVLQRYGRSNWVTGFEVEPGEHVVRILKSGCEGTPEPFTIGGDDGRLVTFMADVDDGYDCRVLLR
jgi:hypothetical protein